MTNPRRLAFFARVLLASLFAGQALAADLRPANPPDAKLDLVVAGEMARRN